MRRVTLALALASAVGASPTPARSAEPDATRPSVGLRVRVVDELCRVRADAPVTCPEVSSIALLRGETASFQVLFESPAARGPLDVTVEGSDGLVVDARREIFLPVRSRTRGTSADGESLAWSATARPPDDEVLGLVADPLVADLRADLLAPAPGGRTAVWIDVRAKENAPAGASAVVVRAGHRERTLAVEIVDASLPAIPVSFFAYLEDAELAVLPDVAQARSEARRILRAHHVSPIATWLDAADVERDRSTTSGVAVLGAYGQLGAPDDASVETVGRMADALRGVEADVVLYAADEDCGSPLPGAWRRAVRTTRRAADDKGEEPALARVRVLATCDRPGLDADVAMVTAAHFTEERAEAEAARGTEVWVYNGLLPHAGPMALDAPPESLVWNGWIAARYDVRRWFYWNTNHWTDRNRGGRGPRDLYADTETFHNADGDVVLGDGILLYPARQAERFTRIETTAPVLGSIRLARLRRGVEDAALLALAHEVDPDLARDVLGRVIPRALGDVPAHAPTPFGRAGVIRAGRAALHAAIARASRDGRIPVRLDGARARASLGGLRASTPVLSAPSSARAIPIALVVLAAGALVALALDRVRRRRATADTSRYPASR